MSSASVKVGTDLLPAPLGETSVYVHIPFCSSRCNYCDFYFETGRSPRLMAAVLDRILEEAEFFLEGMGHPRIRSIYFGGGTPSVVPPALIERFLARFRALLFPDGPAVGTPPEWTFEANPESVSRELLEVLASAGVSRISLGVQSFSDELLRALTRRADSKTVASALALLAGPETRARLPHLNIDLITGIPGQRRADLEEDLRRALEFGPDHFSVYSLTVEERTPLAQAVARGATLPARPEREETLWLAARERLEALGYEWYEISNFALPGCRSAHNASYWRLEPYLGLGPGAVSTLPMLRPGGPRSNGERDGATSGVLAAPYRLTNPNLFVYASRFDRSWNHAVEPLSARDLLFDHLLTGLRTSDGVSLPHLASIFGIDLRAHLSANLEEWRRLGYLDEMLLDGSDRRLALAGDARLLLDRRLAEIESWIDSLPLSAQPRWP